jgi:hypothetical protein
MEIAKNARVADNETQKQSIGKAEAEEGAMNLLGEWAFLKGGAMRFGTGLLVVLCLASSVGKTQYPVTPQTPGQQAPSLQDPLKSPDDESRKGNDPMRGPTSERQARMRNEERQKQLVADSERLLALATQLHDDVAKTNKDILSIDVVKRAAEIEKLAHSVKERMKE